MESPTVPATSQPPLPLRARGVLEILDTAVKLYRQYFWVLIGWSAIVTGATVFGPGGILLYPFVLPLVVGPVVCVVAAAVRGKPVTFKQCWEFTQPRFGGMVVALLLAGLILLAVFIVLSILSVMGFIGTAAALANTSGTIQLAAGIGGSIFFLLLLSIIGAGLMCWSSLAPIVAAMEEDKRNAQALGRAWAMLRGNWVRIVSLMAMLGLGYLVLTGICLGVGATLTGAISGAKSLDDLLTGTSDWGAAFWIMYAVFMLSQVVLGILWNPIQFLLITLFYLDVRVRQEALDIEWTAHQSTPVANSDAAPLTIVTPPVAATPNIGFGVAAVESAAPVQAVAPASNSYATTRLDTDEAVADEPASTPFEQPPQEIEPALTEATISNSHETIVCPQCQTRSAADLTFCPACGTRLKPLW